MSKMICWDCAATHGFGDEYNASNLGQLPSRENPCQHCGKEGWLREVFSFHVPEQPKQVKGTNQ